MFSVIQKKENEIYYSEYKNNSICFFYLNKRKIILLLNNINKINNELEWFIMINKNLLAISGESKISIINVNKYNLERVIDINGSGWILGFAC